MYNYLNSFTGTYIEDVDLMIPFDANNLLLSDGDLYSLSKVLFQTESTLLRILGFQTEVVLPHSLYINYLQALGVSTDPEFHQLAKRTLAHLNSALLSPQLLYVTHQPHSLATASIYLAAKETSVKLPSMEWWKVFDVEREELGFLVAALTSMSSYASAELNKWRGRQVPLTIGELEEELAEQKTSYHNP